MRILHVVGARPNFMKAAPVVRGVEAFFDADQVLVHTGQHYDHNMSELFFEELDLPQPDVDLEVGSDTHARQTGQIMISLEPVLLSEKPELVLVYGDVNSTVAATLVCAKLGIPVGHVEAGLRSFDRAMPEEINRIVTDSLADLLFTPSQDGDSNLKAEGIDDKKIHFVGNLMIDTLIRLLPRASGLSVLSSCGLGQEQYGLVTLHRPSNVDSMHRLKTILATLEEIAEAWLPLIFPLHPRTRVRMETVGYRVQSSRLHLMDPLGYLDFLGLQKQACFVVTDSGGVQEETTYLQIPCLTLRANTERPVTVQSGSNTLVGFDLPVLKTCIENIMQGRGKSGTVPELWDGQANRRLLEVIRDVFQSP